MTYNANITIKNNRIDQGRFTDGSIITEYNYDSHALVGGAALIEGNTFIAPAEDSDMLQTYKGNCIIKYNKFIRNNTTINSYIKQTSVTQGIHNITDNIFDHSTTDGSIEELVVGLIPGSIYTRNINQTGYSYIPLYDNSLLSLGGEFGVITYGDNFDEPKLIMYRYFTPFDNGDGYNNLITEFYTPDANPDDKFEFFRAFNIGSYLEKGMEIISARIGCNFGIGADKTDFSQDDEKFFTLNLRSYDGYANMHAEQIGTIAPDNNKIYRYDISDAGHVLALKAGTEYTVEVVAGSAGSNGDYSGFIRPDYYRIGNGYHLAVEFESIIKFDNNNWFINFTPIEIKYRW